MEKKITCICCPMGCALTVDFEEGKVNSVSGNTCNRGVAYGEKEVTNPTRTVTSIVKVSGGKEKMVSVKTATDIPKGKIFDCLHALKEIEIKAPVKIGDIIVKNVANTGVDIIATRKVGI